MINDIEGYIEQLKRRYADDDAVLQLISMVQRFQEPNASYTMIPARRLRAATDLGFVRAGDRLLAINDAVVAVDTSSVPDILSARPPPVEAKSRPIPARVEETKRAESKTTQAQLQKKAPRHRFHRPVAFDDLSIDHLTEIIQQHQPVKAISVSDRLGIDRKDEAMRQKVWRLLRDSSQTGFLTRLQDPTPGTKQYLYSLSEGDNETTLSPADEGVSIGDGFDDSIANIGD